MSQSPFAPGQPVLLTAFDVVGEALDTAGDCALFGLTDDQAVEGLRRASVSIARMEAVGLRLVSEVVGRDLARRCGMTSPTVFLRDKVRWSPREAARRVRLARTLDDDALAEVWEALRRGDVNLEHADVIGRMFRVLKRAGVSRDDLTVALEMQLASANRFDPATLSTLARRTVAALAPKTEEDRERQARNRRGFTLRSNDDGTVTISGSMSQADALELAAVIDILAAPRPGPNGERDLRTPAARRMDAVLEMAAYVARHGHDDGTELDDPDDPDADTDTDTDTDTDGGDGYGDDSRHNSGHSNGHSGSGHGGGSGPGGGVARTGSCAGAGPGGCGDHGDGPGFNPDSLFDLWNLRDPTTSGDDPDGSGDGDGPGNPGSPAPDPAPDPDAAPAGDGGRRPAAGRPAAGKPPGKAGRGRRRGGLPQIIITCGLSYLLGLAENGMLSGPETLTQLPLTRAAFELISCNAIIRRLIFDPRGVPLDVGRKSRTVTPAIRDAVIARDRVCTYPSCDRPPGWSQVHHVDHWTRDGGETRLLNSALVCVFHHNLVHHHGYEVRIGEHGRPEWRSPYNIDPTGTWRVNELREPRCPLQRPTRT
jgi:Domain of unknown function (DUF222)